ncbi:hypothetical protein [Phaeovulum veldkampii]|nr:hypothetical protein [Phaeovulum veldkampii]
MTQPPGPRFHAPAPRLTPWVALLVACGLSALYLAGLGLAWLCG